MAPTESSILSSFLLTPAPLETAITKESFAALFGNYADHEDVQVLYRALSQQVKEGIEGVKANISAESQRGAKQQRQIAKTRTKTHQTRIDSLDLQDVQMDMELRDGEPSGLILSEAHTLKSILPQISAAGDDLEQQILAIEQETAETLEDIKQTVGGLSDLRYGRLPKVAGGDNSIADETMDALQRLQQVAQETQTSSSTS